MSATMRARLTGPFFDQEIDFAVHPVTGEPFTATYHSGNGFCCTTRVIELTENGFITRSGSVYVLEILT
jgi:hypothetical protein